jgi:predicted ester cyclase
MKPIFFFLLAVAFSLLACNNNSESTVSTESRDSAKTVIDDKETKEIRNRKIVMQSIEAFNAHDIDGVMKDSDPNTVEYGDGSMAPVKGVDSVKAGLKMWFDAVPNVKGEDFKVVADGDWVMVYGKWTGTWKNPLMGQKATGKSYNVYDVDIFKLNTDGKILEHHNVQSPETIAYQIGLKMPK